MADAKPSPARTLVGPTLSSDPRATSEARIAVTMPALRVVAGPDMLRFATLYPPDGRVVIGRDAGCNLPLTDGSVSRRHAVVEQDAEGRIWVSDLGSTNGTAIGGVPVTERTLLPDGAMLVVGAVTLRLDRLSLKELSHLTKVVERLSLANKDALTGLVTRRYLDEELPGLVNRHAANGVPVSAVFFDVDHFKRVNDSFGHGVGDEVLRTVSRLVIMHVRDSDTVVRYGGEEIVAILPNCDVEGAYNTAERVRIEVMNHAWSSYAPSLAVTLSSGVATFRSGEPLSDWLDRADKALYEAKRGGRNQTVRAAVPLRPDAGL